MSALNITHIGILSFIEGLTEFIPVSSTAHLLLASKALGFKSEESTFEIAIQLGAISAVIVYYRRYFLNLIKEQNTKDLKKILIATIPVLIIGFIGYDFIKSTLFNPLSIAIALIAGSILMILAEKKTLKAYTPLNKLTLIQSFKIGCFQCLALWPGMSRSGATICGGLFNNLNHKQSAQFSFILGVPVIGAAVMYDLFKSFNQLTSNNLLAIGLGTLFSFFISLVAIGAFLKLLEHTKLLPFAIYRIVLAIGILISYSIGMSL